MQRATWTDERLDEFAKSTDVRLDHARDDIRAVQVDVANLRTEVRKGFDSVRGDIAAVRGEIDTLRGEMGQQVAGLRGEIGTVRGEVGGVRTEMRQEIATLRTEMGQEIASLRLLVMRLGAGTIVALAGVIATIGITG